MSAAKVADKPIITWKCDGVTCGVAITTTDEVAWNKHLSTLPHRHKGFGICKDCGAKEIAFDEIYADRNPHNGGGEIIPVYCQACLTRIAEKAKKGAKA
jgi:uncharacterized protein YlaI